MCGRLPGISRSAFALSILNVRVLWIHVCARTQEVCVEARAHARVHILVCAYDRSASRLSVRVRACLRACVYFMITGVQVEITYKRTPCLS